MIIILINGQFELQEPDNFRSLKLVVEASAADNLLETQLGRKELDYVWVREEWFMQQPPATVDAWVNSFRDMKEYASGKGWVDASGAIRVHIETSPLATDQAIDAAGTSARVP